MKSLTTLLPSRAGTDPGARLRYGSLARRAGIGRGLWGVLTILEKSPEANEALHPSPVTGAQWRPCTHSLAVGKAQVGCSGLSYAPSTSSLGHLFSRARPTATGPPKLCLWPLVVSPPSPAKPSSASEELGLPSLHACRRMKGERPVPADIRTLGPDPGLVFKAPSVAYEG